MIYERLTKRAGFHKDIDLKDELGYSHIYQRLSELENKIEDGTLVDVGGYFIEKGSKVGSTFPFVVCQHFVQTLVCDFFDSREEAEANLKELQQIK